MFDLFIYTAIQSFWISLFISLPLLFLLRFYIIYPMSFSIKETLLILLLPASIGFYIYVKQQTTLILWYKRLVVISFIFMFIASILLLYMRLELILI
jgi:hypothetical protein